MQISHEEMEVEGWGGKRAVEKGGKGKPGWWQMARQKCQRGDRSKPWGEENG